MSRQQMRDIQFVGPTKNIVKVSVEPNVTLNLKNLERHFYTSSSCGICGKSSIESIKTKNPNSICNLEIQESLFQIEPCIIHGLPDKLREQQGIFDSTGGLHACGTFDSQGNLSTSEKMWGATMP